MLDIIAANLTSPAVLCFVLGAFAVAVRSDLALPEPIFVGLSIYLMLSIGLRGGGELGAGHLSAIGSPLVAALVLACLTPVWCFFILRRSLGPIDAAAMAAHYGSVSALTFAAVTTMLDRQGVPFEGYAAGLLAIMEVPAVVIGIAIAKRSGAGHEPGRGRSGQGLGMGRGLGQVLGGVLASKSVLLLVGGLVIGLIVGPAGLVRVKPLFGDLFQGALCLFLLELGRVAALGAREFRRVGVRLAAFAVVMPVVHGALGVGAAWLAGMSFGGAVVLGTLAASASYIAAPAAVRMALPQANAAFCLTCSVAITFPFNIAIGLPLYQTMARALYG